MTYRIFDFSGDVGVEAEAPTVEAALVELGRGLAHVITDGSPIEPRHERRIEVEAQGDWPAAAVDFLNELVFLFDTEFFLVAEGRLEAQAGPGRVRIEGVLRGEAFDPARHRGGRGVKAATHHDPLHESRDGRHRFRVVLDL